MTIKSGRIAEIRAVNNGRGTLQAAVGPIDAEKRTVELAFSSEEPVTRWYGREILSHDPGAVIMDRLHDGAPLLLNHDAEQIGVVERASIDADRRGRAVVRFSRSARAQEIFQDVLDGIRRHVSVGYMVHDGEMIDTDDDEPTTVRWTRWEPLEISIVPVPADHTVGVGRALETPEKTQRTTDQPPADNTPENTENPREENDVSIKPTTTADTATTIETGNDAAENERARCRAIAKIGEMYRVHDLAARAIADGDSVQEFQEIVLARMAGTNQAALSEQIKSAEIGLTAAEARNFSVMNLIRAMAEPSDRKAQEKAAFEFDACRAAADKLEKQPKNGVIIPADVLTARALNTGTGGSAADGATGGNLVATDLLASSFIDMLRNRSTALRLGRTLGGLVGNVDIPRQISGGQGYWIGEDEDAGLATQAFGQIPITPKTVAAYSEITRRMLNQSSIDVEALVRLDLATSMALTIDKAAYYGSGSQNQPRGITKYDGVNAVNFAAQQPTFAELVAMETEIAVDNADVSSMAYVANAKFRGHAKTALKFEGVGAGTIWEQGGSVNGYRTEITNQINDGDVIMGNFGDLIVAMWGGLEINVDPYSNSKSGRLRIITFQDIDFALRRVESFCLGKKA